ncbi:isocitrate dehydrogenase [Trifolium medium]|uniref:Isocitrate dehydrogenase n=1 Tax=Trifolium medium TaxID=97028 RepID=A0A392W0G7_9FABA|nr:isocitrate dehydrogenase [Trifolium medium]
MASQILRRTLGSRYLSNPRPFSSASTPIRATLFPGDGSSNGKKGAGKHVKARIR